MLTDDQIRRFREHLRNMTDEESDQIWEEMIRDGIIDRNGKVLVRMPEGPPDWARSVNGQPTDSIKKKKRAHKRS